MKVDASKARPAPADATEWKTFASGLRHFKSHPLRSLTAGLGVLALPVIGFFSREVVDGAPEESPAQIFHGVKEQAAQLLADSDLSVMALNVWGKPEFITGTSDERFQIIKRYLEEEQLDLVALQEVWFKSAEDPFRAIEGVDLALSPYHRSIFQKSGLLTLSRFPIERAKSYSFEAESGFQALSEKGALFCEIVLPEQKRAYVWNIHLQSGTESEWLRVRQVKQLLDWIVREQEAQDKNPDCLLVLGDFNCGPGSQAFSNLKSGLSAFGNLMVSEVGDTYVPGENNYAEGSKPSAFDHILVLGNKAAEQIKFSRVFDKGAVSPAIVSDHYGVLANLSFPEFRQKLFKDSDVHVSRLIYKDSGRTESFKTEK